MAMYNEIISKHLKNISHCAFCGNSASSKCAACTLVVYCSKEHQKAHWKQHKNECLSYELQIDSNVGRHLIAKRTINPFEIIIQEEPLVIGPKFPTSEPICIKCLQRLKRSESLVESLCEKCLWPICGTGCVTSINKNIHEGECTVLVKGSEKIAKNNDYMYDALTPLKCLLLQFTDKNKWNRLMELKSHMEYRGPESEVYEEINSVYNYLKNNYLSGEEFETSSDLIHTICGILDVNALDVQVAGLELTAIYPTVSKLEHNCLPNTGISFDKCGRIYVYASRKITKGEHITTMYTNALWGTRERRAHLLSTKYFKCKCKRCSDATELGTNFSTIVCNVKGFCKGNLTPIHPLDDSSEWECDRCPNTVSSDKIDAILTELNHIVDKALQNPSINSLEDAFSKLKTRIHSNHYLCFNVKHTLIQLYGHSMGYKHSMLTDDLLKRKSELCRDMFFVLNIIDPLYIRLNIYTSVILYELHLALLESAARISENKAESKGMRDEAKVLLSKALDILKNEPEGSPGFKLLQAYKPSIIK
ncbi:SET domain-containing protein SmydA-8 [Acyrthosiphon pisum]|uniref:MYND-type domain-containing protein n=2 Tax=Acyrthosiphon pisum TaxID=7029 RepID=A0A8R1W7S1_ACYPI|nr:SET domain-containing protein SmydA-8 [Acyrthosiphon pisum]|eukprot:XP_001950081.1 PREDICTED: protein msta [Acyrthosiphon pisum]